jgi:hypothetical protein
VDFSEALRFMKCCRRVRRAGWTKNTWLYLCIPNVSTAFIKTNTDNSWAPNIADILANDWEIAT